MEAKALDDAIRNILLANAKISVPAAEIGRSTDLFSIGLDSMSVVNVMFAIEETFDVAFPESRLTRASFSTIGSLSSIVQDMRAAA